jgi:hypothetical protein
MHQGEPRGVAGGASAFAAKAAIEGDAAACCAGIGAVPVLRSPIHPRAPERKVLLEPLSAETSSGDEGSMTHRPQRLPTAMKRIVTSTYRYKRPPPKPKPRRLRSRRPS